MTVDSTNLEGIFAADTAVADTSHRDNSDCTGEIQAALVKLMDGPMTLRGAQGVRWSISDDEKDDPERQDDY